MLKIITSTLMIVVLSIIVAGCAGRAANPVMAQQYGDSKKSCNALRVEMSFVESEILRLIPETSKTGKNVALGTAGVFLLVPFFFMDFSEAEQIEVNALRKRYNHLAILSEEKNCGFEVTPMQDFKSVPKPDTNN